MQMSRFILPIILLTLLLTGGILLPQMDVSFLSPNLSLGKMKYGNEFQFILRLLLMVG